MAFWHLHEADNCDHLHDTESSFEIRESFYSQDVDDDNERKEYRDPGSVIFQWVTPILKRY
jgi:hypothetical protein